MAQVGHNDPKVTLGIYAKVIASNDDHGAALDGLIGTLGDRSPSRERFGGRPFLGPTRD
jgi:hypothetical protein